MNTAVFGPENIEAVLKRRGFTIGKRGNYQDILLPLEREPPLSGEQINEFRRLFSKISFRKLCREIILGQGELNRLTKIASGRADEHIEFLEDLGVVQRSNHNVVLSRQINNIGSTLEWFVADVCKREFDGSAEWSVCLPQVRHGSDFDVLAWLPPTLMYIETKSKRPSGLEGSELKHFLQRGEELAPDLAILLIDTEDDLDRSGFVSRLFEVMLPTVRLASGITDPTWRHDEKPLIAPIPGYREVHFGYRRFYVINSDPSIQGQLRTCLRHYHRHVKGQPFYSGLPVDFVTGELEG